MKLARHRGRGGLGEHLSEHGKDAEALPNGLATMWFYLTDDRSEADRILQQRLVPAIHRPENVLRERLPVGPAGTCVERLAAFREAGVQRVLVWPVADEPAPARALL